MLVELAILALILALMLSLVQASYAFGFKRISPIIQTASLLNFSLILFAFVTLILLRIDNDFSLQNIADNSNVALPLLYKIAGTWGNHEGSILLWVLVLSGFAALLACGRDSQSPLIVKTLVIQSLLVAGTLVFILATSNPFARISPPAFDGAMLNPLLQDMALAIHPPMLYGGYVGFSLVFSFAVAGLWQREIGREWANIVHPWIMLAWSMLTFGIGLGSWWAYRELGWGGFWFWDPVENASLLPWLAGTALFHSNIVLKKRGLLAGWVVLLAIITFGLSLMGTFLVRSGLLTSVHSFASDPKRGLYILGFIALSLGGALWLYAVRIKDLTATAPLRPSSREGMIVINNLFLLTACATVLIGTTYPMLAEMLLGRSISVGAPYYNRIFLPLMALPLLFAGLTPFMPWKKAAFRQSLIKSSPAFAAALVAAALLAAYVKTDVVMAICGFSLAAYLLVASAQWLMQSQWKKAGSWTVFLGHLGAAFLVFGITGAGLWSQQVEKFVGIEESISIAAYKVTYFDEEQVDTPNYSAKRAHILLFKDTQQIAELTPEYRRYKIREQKTSESAIYSTPAFDIYAVIGEASADGKKTALRVYYKPTIAFIWSGCLLMMFGGLLVVWLSTHKKREEDL